MFVHIFPCKGVDDLLPESHLQEYQYWQGEFSRNKYTKKDSYTFRYAYFPHTYDEASVPELRRLVDFIKTSRTRIAEARCSILVQSEDTHFDYCMKAELIALLAQIDGGDIHIEYQYRFGCFVHLRYDVDPEAMEAAMESALEADTWKKSELASSASARLMHDSVIDSTDIATVIGCLPHSASHLEAILRSDLPEIHFTAFCYMDSLLEMSPPESQDYLLDWLLSELHTYIVEPPTSDDLAPWMAGDLLGDHLTPFAEEKVADAIVALSSGPLKKLSLVALRSAYTGFFVHVNLGQARSRYPSLMSALESLDAEYPGDFEPSFLPEY